MEDSVPFSFLYLPQNFGEFDGKHPHHHWKPTTICWIRMQALGQHSLRYTLFAMLFRKLKTYS